MRKTLPLIAALLVGAVVAIAAVSLLGGDDGDDKAATPAKSETQAVIPESLREGEQLVGPNGAFRLRYPKSWKVVNADDLDASGGVPLAAVRQEDGQAVLVVQEQQGRLAETRKQIAEGLTQRLKKDIKDFQFVSSDEVKLPAGEALSYTFVRSKSGQVQNLVVIPRGGTTYTLNSVVSGKADKAATEVSDMIKTFDPEK